MQNKKEESRVQESRGIQRPYRGGGDQKSFPDAAAYLECIPNARSSCWDRRVGNHRDQRQENWKRVEESVKEENEMKKAFLERYWTSKKIQESIWDEIRELKYSVMLPGINMDGMPHGTGSSDLSSYAVQLNRLEKKLSREVGRQIRIRNQIWKAIEGLPTEAEKMICEVI